MLKGGFHTATTDPEVIRQLWAEADYNLALSPEDAGLCVIDLDGEVGKLWLQSADLPPTRTIATPNGGLHLYFDGSLASTVSRLAPKVDTRGRGGYVLVPPSMVDGKPYRVVDDTPPAPLPAQIPEQLRSRELPHLAAPEGVELDQPWMIDLARDYLKRVHDKTGPWGHDDDPDTYAIAAAVKDHGISAELAGDLMMEYLSEDERDWLEQVVTNAYHYGQNEPGSKALPNPAVWQVEQYAPPPAAADEETAVPAITGRFASRKPSEDATRAPLEYWDNEKTLPKIPGGCAGLAYGPRSSHKSGTVLKKFADAAFDRGAKVLYIAGEGAHGIQTARLPKLCEQRSRRVEELDDRWRTLAVTPNLLRLDEIAEVVKEYREFKPDLIAIDTVTRAASGADINHPSVGTAIVLGMEALGEPFNATVLGVTHPGKDAERGAIGSKLVEDLSYFVWKISHDAGLVRVYLDKMKDGPAEFITPYRVTAGGVPVVVDVSAEEREIILKGGPTHDEIRDQVFAHVYARLGEGEKTSLNDSGWGSRMIAVTLNVEKKLVKEALDQLVARKWLVRGEKGDGYQLPLGGRHPDSY